MKVPGQILQALNCSEGDLKPTRMGFQHNGKSYIFKEGGAMANHKAEFLSLKSMWEAAPGFVPEPIAVGTDEDTGRTFYCSEYVDMGSCSGKAAQSALGRRLAEMHLHNSTKAEKPVEQHGFQVPTFCGDSKMDNSWNSSWADFWANQRLRAIAKDCRGDTQLQQQVDQVCDKVVPLLCGSDKIKPALLHGDLWAGNIATRSGSSDPVVFDACSFYGHNESDFGIAVMFGGFTRDFFNAYHEVIPKLEPFYEERQQLYELYHQLNHAALFGGGGYSRQASRNMSELLKWASKQD